jgi:hypothetical protein
MTRLAALALALASSSAMGADQPAPAPPTCPTALAQPVPMVPAARFLDSMGINLHVDQGYPAQTYVEPLRYLGLRQIRDGSRHVEAMIALARATAIGLTMIAQGDLDTYLSAAHAAHRAGVLTAIEGPNEPNNFPVTYQGKSVGRDKDWDKVAAYQRDLYRSVKSDPTLRDVPVFTISEVGAQQINTGLQFLTIPPGAGTQMPDGTAYADYANAHNYLAGTSGAYGPNQAWQAADPALRGRWDGLAGNFGRTWRRGFAGYGDAQLAQLPRVTTETGLTTGGDAASEALQATALVQAYLAQFARGWRYTFVYQLRDDEGGLGKHGVYAGNRAKPAAIALHNLTTALRGAGRPSTSQPPASQAAFAAGSDTLHALGLIGVDSAPMLAVWNETTGTPSAFALEAGPGPVTIYNVMDGQTRNLPPARRHCLRIGAGAWVLRW